MTGHVARVVCSDVGSLCDRRKEEEEEALGLYLGRSGLRTKACVTALCGVAGAWRVAPGGGEGDAGGQRFRVWKWISRWVVMSGLDYLTAAVVAESGNWVGMPWRLGCLGIQGCVGYDMDAV